MASSYVDPFAPSAGPFDYAGRTFRNQLEVAWAATFIALGFEPQMLYTQNDDGWPSWYMQHMKVWAEMDDPGRASELSAWAQDITDVAPEPHLLVLLGATESGFATWRGLGAQGEVVLCECTRCAQWTFLDDGDLWRCRQCGAEGKFWLPDGAYLHSGHLHLAQPQHWA